MRTEIANALFGYFETLYNINKSLIELCGIDVIDDFEDGHKKILDIIQDIPRIIPCIKGRKNNILTFKDSDGLFEYKKEIPYLDSEYKKILKNNYSFLEKIKNIRNTYEHKMHGVRHRASSSGTLTYFEYMFKVDMMGTEKEIEVEAREFIKLFKELNILFSELLQDVKKYAAENDKMEYPYYRRILRFDFTEFNNIYDSKNLRSIGKIMRKF